MTVLSYDLRADITTQIRVVSVKRGKVTIEVNGTRSTLREGDTYLLTAHADQKMGQMS